MRSENLIINKVKQESKTTNQNPKKVENNLRLTRIKTLNITPKNPKKQGPGHELTLFFSCLESEWRESLTYIDLMVGPLEIYFKNYYILQKLVKRRNTFSFKPNNLRKASFFKAHLCDVKPFPRTSILLSFMKKGHVIYQTAEKINYIFITCYKLPSKKKIFHSSNSSSL